MENQEAVGIGNPLRRRHLGPFAPVRDGLRFGDSGHDNTFTFKGREMKKEMKKERKRAGHRGRPGQRSGLATSQSETSNSEGSTIGKGVSEG